LFPLKDTIPSYRRPYITVTIIIINVVVFLYEMSLSRAGLLKFLYTYGIVPARYTNEYFALRLGVSRFNFFPFISAMFMHGGWLHLISNMWALWLFGDNVEDRMGHLRFAIFYILSGIIASLFHFIFNWDSRVPMIGASGAISGVMGAYFIMFPRSNIITFFPILFIPMLIPVPAFIYLGIWFLSQFFNGAFSIIAGVNFGGVAWWAHIGGFLGGMYTHRFFLDRRYLDRFRYYRMRW